MLVGPGGAYAIETKWSATSWDSEYGRGRLQDAIEQSRLNARRLELWHPFKSRHVHVDAVVVLWGGGVSDCGDRHFVMRVDGVTILAGSALRSWATNTHVASLQANEIAEAWTALDAQIKRRDPVDALASPVPASVAELLTRTGAAFAMAALGALYLGQLIRVIELWWLALLVGAVSGVSAAVLIRQSIVRPAAWGWLIGVGLPSGGLLIAEVVYRATP